MLFIESIWIYESEKAKMSGENKRFSVNSFFFNDKRKAWIWEQKNISAMI